ncbi:MAG: amidohydrolase family protein [Gammaproteobacteria bacterium]
MAANQNPQLRSRIYDGPIFDGDTHIQEGNLEFMKEYLPARYHEKWLPALKTGKDGRYGLYIGERMVENADFDPSGLVPPPGRLKEWLRAIKNGEPTVAGRVKPTPDMLDRDERVRKLDEFGVEGSLLFTGSFVSAVGYFPEPDAGHAVFHAYNRYVCDQWGFNYKDRLYGTGLLALWDLDKALEELDWMLRQGVRAVIMPMGPGADNRSAADPYYDPVWSRLNEAGVLVTYHVSEANFMHPVIRAFGEKELQSRRLGQTAWQWMFTYSEIPVMMSIANLIYNNLFGRFPNLKLATVENGADWVPRFLTKMDKMRGMAKNGYWPNGQLKQRPSEIFKRHCFAVAYPEDDVKGIVEQLGTADCILMGSDYPHAEGVPTPKDFYTEALTDLPDDVVRKIMHENGRRMLPRSH